MVDPGNLVHAADASGHRGAHPARPDRRALHAAAGRAHARSPSEHGAAARSPSTRLSRDGATPARQRAARAHRQPDQPGHRDHAPQGDRPQPDAAALAQPVRQGAPAAHHAQGRAGGARRGGAARPEGTFVYVVGRRHDRRLAAGRDRAATEGEVAIVASGLAEGERVVVDGQNQLQPGATVAPRAGRARPRGQGGARRAATARGASGARTRAR